jgi:hypothetical protein
MAACSKYIEKPLHLDPKKENIYFDHYDPSGLINIVATQHKVADFMKKRKYTKLYQILVIVDDFAGESSFSRHSKLLHSLYTRGRHNSISAITTTQAFTALST